MEAEVRERFERIEKNLEVVGQRLDRFSDNMDALRESQVELTASQKNTDAKFDKLVGVVNDIGEKISDLAILVDELVKRDLGRQ